MTTSLDLATQEKDPMRLFLFKDQSNTNTASTLINLGNTCFFNSIVQALKFTKPMMELISSGSVAKKDDLFGLFMDLVIVMSKKNYLIKPSKFYNAFCVAKKKFDSEHEDAHEILFYLLDKFEESLRYDGKVSYFDREWEHELIQKSLDAMKHIQLSPIHNIFMGQYHQEVVCSNCQNASHSFLIYNDIQLHIPPGNSYLNIHHLLRQNCSTEVLEKCYSCDACGQKNVSAEKTTMLFRLPKILVIQFVRFDWMEQDSNGYAKKICRFIDFPIWELDMTDYCDYPYKGRIIYDLYAVVYHQGRTFAGHYWTVAKSGMHWVELDDDKHKYILHEDDVVAGSDDSSPSPPTAYMLFYHRREE